MKDVCYFNPFYVAWCLENWQGFSLTGYERSNYMKGLERQLEKDPEAEEEVMLDILADNNMLIDRKS